MNENDLFEKGCFSPDWTTDDNILPSVQRKDLKTLLDELGEIKEKIQEIQARQWHLARLLNFHNNQLARE